MYRPPLTTWSYIFNRYSSYLGFLYLVAQLSFSIIIITKFFINCKNFESPLGESNSCFQCERLMYLPLYERAFLERNNVDFLLLYICLVSPNPFIVYSLASYQLGKGVLLIPISELFLLFPLRHIYFINFCLFVINKVLLSKSNQLSDNTYRLLMRLPISENGQRGLNPYQLLGRQLCYQLHYTRKIQSL